MQDAILKYCVSRFPNNKNCPANNYISKESFIHNIVYLSPGKIYFFFCIVIEDDALVEKHSILETWNAHFVPKAGFSGDYKPAFINFVCDGGNFRADGGDFRADGSDFRADGSDFSADGGNFRADDGDFRADSGNFRADGGNFRADGGDFRDRNSNNNMFFQEFNILYL